MHFGEVFKVQLEWDKPERQLHTLDCNRRSCATVEKAGFEIDESLWKLNL